MGWTAHYQVVRETGLNEREVVLLAELLRRQRKQPWDAETFQIWIARTPRADRVIVDGWNKLSMGSESNDPRLLEAALAELSQLLGGELRVSDDFGAFEATERPIHIPYGELVDPTKLVAASPVTVAGPDLNALIDALAATEDRAQQEQLRAQLAARDPREVAAAIYTRYAALGRNWEVRSSLGDALRRLPDAAAVAREFLAVWCAPNGTYYYGDMPLPDTFAAAVGKVPEVSAQLVADVADVDGAGEDEDIPYRRAEAALNVLALAGQLRAVIESVRARRGKRLPWRIESYAFNGAHKALAQQRDPRVAPTLLYFIGSVKKFGFAGHIVNGLVTLAPERVRPHVLAFARRGVHRPQVIEWLRKLGGTEELALADQLAKREEASIYDRAVDVDLRTRHDALRKLAERKDPATFVSLVLAEALDKYLRARYDDPGLPFSWYDWKDVLPREAIEHNTAKKLQWMDLVGKSMLGEQQVWPQVAEILKVGPAKIAEKYPSETLDFDAATLAGLEAEETALLAQL